MISNRASSLSSKHHFLHTRSVWKNSEADYVRALTAAKIPYTEATRKENMAHIDYWVEFKDKNFSGRKSVDIKGLKKGVPSGEITLELKNVRGEPGWCSEHGPDVIAFSFGLFFLHVPTPTLLAAVSRVCDLSQNASSFRNILYKSYSRTDRKDVLTAVKLHDIMREEGEFFYLPVPPPEEIKTED